MKGGTTNLFSSDLTEYELNLKIDYEKKEIAKLEEELDNDLEDEQHTSKLDTNRMSYLNQIFQLLLVILKSKFKEKTLLSV